MPPRADRAPAFRGSLMIQGCGSNVGKSLLVAGLCRAALRRGIRVAPFKPQNLSNNAAVTADGGEIGRAQALQAMACGLEPTSDMNPVLLMQEGGRDPLVVVQGRRLAGLPDRDRAGPGPGLMQAVLDSFARLRAAHDLVIVEGAGSPAEVNLRRGDIANMGFARAAGVPVVLAGDIDRGGVIAQIVGTRAVLDAGDAAMVAGFLVNRFRGDPRLFDEDYRQIGLRSGWRGFGVLPWFPEAHLLPAEDALDLPRAPPAAPGVTVACLACPRIADFDELDPLAAEPGVRLVMLRPGEAVPGDARLVILPGSRAPHEDLRFLRAEGWDIDLAAHRRRGGHILGIGGGYRMLGRRIGDPEGIGGMAGESGGLGLLEVGSVMRPAGRPVPAEALHVGTQMPIPCHEIPSGPVGGEDCRRPFARIGDRAEGAVSADGRVMGTSLHGIFAADAFRRAFLAGLGIAAGAVPHREAVEGVLDALAAHLEAHLDVPGLLALAPRAGG